MRVLADLQCTRVRRRISEVVLSGEQLSTEGARHAASCLSCQAEFAHYRTIERAFAVLRNDVDVAPPELVGRIMAGLDRTPLPWFRRPVAVSVSAASAVAVIATVAVALRRRQVAA